MNVLHCHVANSDDWICTNVYHRRANNNVSCINIMQVAIVALFSKDAFVTKYATPISQNQSTPIRDVGTFIFYDCADLNSSSKIVLISVKFLFCTKMQAQSWKFCILHHFLLQVSTLNVLGFKYTIFCGVFSVVFFMNWLTSKCLAWEHHSPGSKYYHLASP